MGRYTEDAHKDFYRTNEWKQCRAAYLKKVNGLCERCLKMGLITPAEIVHHKKYISMANLSNPEITLNHANLEALCRRHHAEEHTKRKKRYKVDEFGHVTIIEDEAPSMSL